jgi:CRISPR-associated protein Cas6
LSQAVEQALPWFPKEGNAGIHSIHVADSGNGWMRPEKAQDLLYPSRRTKLILRLPGERVDEASELSGKTLDIAGHEMQVQQATVKPLSTHTTLFSRYIATGDDGDEGSFLQTMIAWLGELNIRPKKMLCGIEKTICTPENIIRTRSLMVADLSVEESIRLQQRGLGPWRLLGCGLFIPHKDIQEVNAIRG